MEGVHLDIRIRHSTATTPTEISKQRRQFVPAVGTRSPPFDCPGRSAVSEAGWFNLEVSIESHLYRFELEPRGLFLRSCAKFRWDIRWGRWVRFDAFERHHQRYGRMLSPRAQPVTSSGVPQTSGAGPAPASHGNAVDTPAADAATQSFGNTDAGVLKK